MPFSTLNNVETLNPDKNTLLINDLGDLIAGFTEKNKIASTVETNNVDNRVNSHIGVEFSSSSVRKIVAGEVGIISSSDGTSIEIRVVQNGNTVATRNFTITNSGDHNARFDFSDNPIYIKGDFSFEFFCSSDNPFFVIETEGGNYTVSSDLSVDGFSQQYGIGRNDSVNETITVMDSEVIE